MPGFGDRHPPRVRGVPSQRQLRNWSNQVLHCSWDGTGPTWRRGPSGLRHSHTATSVITATGGQCAHAFGAKSQRITAQTAIASVAVHLALRLTAPCACQSWISGPKRGCAFSQASSRGEPRAAAKAESSTSGVVGSPGTTIPTSPSASADHASSHHNTRRVAPRWPCAGVPPGPGSRGSGAADAGGT